MGHNDEAFNVLQSPIGRMASRPMRNIETFTSGQMYLHLTLVERKVTEFYHDIDRRRWLVLLKWLFSSLFPDNWWCPCQVILISNDECDNFFDKPGYCRWHPSDFSFLSTSADKTSTLWALPPVWAWSSWCWRWWWTSPSSSPSSPILFQKTTYVLNISVVVFDILAIHAKNFQGVTDILREMC